MVIGQDIYPGDLIYYDTYPGLIGWEASIEGGATEKEQTQGTETEF